jgi:hypothetical protein
VAATSAAKERYPNAKSRAKDFEIVFSFKFLVFSWKKGSGRRFLGSGFRLGDFRRKKSEA